MDNKHVNVIPPETMAEVKRKIAEVAALLVPYIIPLTVDERRHLPKMGDKTLSFVGKAHELALANPALCPQYLNVPEFGIDFEDAVSLVSLKNAVKQVYEGIDDTEMVAGSEAFQAALVFYNYVKSAAANDVYGAKAVYEELKTRFPGKKKKSVVDDGTDSL
jgi:hypothetical protein